MKKLLVVMALAVFMTGCAEERKFIKSPFGGPDVLACQADYYSTFRAMPYQGYRTQAYDKVPFAGFMVVEAEGKVMVDTIIGGENINKELRRDDQVVSVNGKAVTGKKQFLELVRGQRFDEISFLTFRRYSSEFTLGIRLNQMVMSRLYTNFEKKLLENKKVSIAIIPSANTTLTNATIDKAALSEQDKNYIGAAYEKVFIEEFSSYINFSIIDRNMLEKIIAEQKFQVSGAVDDTTIQKIGKITGASHLYFITMGRNETSFSFTDRLVEVETAKLVYSDSYVYNIPKIVVKKKKDKNGKDIDEDDKDSKKKETTKTETNVSTPIVINNYITNTNTNTNVVSNSNVNNNTGNNSNTTTINNK